MKGMRVLHRPPGISLGQSGSREAKSRQPITVTHKLLALADLSGEIIYRAHLHFGQVLSLVCNAGTFEMDQSQTGGSLRRGKRYLQFRLHGGPPQIAAVAMWFIP